MKYKIILIFFFILLNLPATILAVEVAPRISDREIIEKLVGLESGQAALNKRMTELREEMETGQASLRKEMKEGDAALRKEMKEGYAALRKEIKEGDAALRSEIKEGNAALREEMKKGDAALGKRIDDLNIRMTSMENTMLTLFGTMVALIVALFAYIAWDRRTMLKPVVERLEHLERDVMRDLDISHKDGSLLTRLVNAMRELAKHDPKVASVLRSFSLL